MENFQAFPQRGGPETWSILSSIWTLIIGRIPQKQISAGQKGPVPSTYVVVYQSLVLYLLYISKPTVASWSTGPFYLLYNPSSLANTDQKTSKQSCDTHTLLMPLFFPFLSLLFFPHFHCATLLTLQERQHRPWSALSPSFSLFSGLFPMSLSVLSLLSTINKITLSMEHPFPQILHCAFTYRWEKQNSEIGSLPQDHMIHMDLTVASHTLVNKYTKNHFETK